MIEVLERRAIGAVTADMTQDIAEDEAPESRADERIDPDRPAPIPLQPETPEPVAESTDAESEAIDPARYRWHVQTLAGSSSKFEKFYSDIQSVID